MDLTANPPGAIGVMAREEDWDRLWIAGVLAAFWGVLAGVFTWLLGDPPQPEFWLLVERLLWLAAAIAALICVWVGLGMWRAQHPQD